MNGMRNGYIIDTFTSGDAQEKVNLGGKVMKMCKGSTYKENCESSLIRRGIEILFNSRIKYKEEGNDIMQTLVKILMNSLNDENYGRDITDVNKCKSGYCMSTGNDERALHFWWLPEREHIVELGQDECLE